MALDERNTCGSGQMTNLLPLKVDVAAGRNWLDVEEVK
jgi:hypothetical protein